MKMMIPALLALLCVTSAHAEFRTWTRIDGKTAELELLSVGEKDGAQSGYFKMHDGQKVFIKSSDLSEADAKLLGEWKPPAPAGAAVASVFDEHLDDNLLILDGTKLKPLADLKKPSKYYLFYYTASWCGPCKKFTPSLVDFYTKSKNDKFEVVLISSDEDQASMEKYAVSHKMTWPHLKFSKIRSFKNEFKHPGTGIPNLVLCDVEGKIIMSSYVKGKYIGPTAVMNHLETLLKE